MTTVILTARAKAAQANRSTVNDFDANNTPISKLGTFMQSYKTAYSEIVTVKGKGGKRDNVLFNLYPDGRKEDRLTIFINGKLRNAHLAQPFKVTDLFSNSLFETYYKDGDGKEQMIITLQKPSAGIPEQTIIAFESIVDALAVAAAM